ncbi:hypothetical protein [Paracoccus broussonetiae]|uniref:hypothetical protein n=1 Tax=Paracoccus broussonetiae TaxID=3075834 RepID=UPI00288BE03D|nr:hypothetical protein [Paracoccus sp. CPCC 101403]
MAVCVITTGTFLTVFPAKPVDILQQRPLCDWAFLFALILGNQKIARRLPKADHVLPRGHIPFEN